MSSQPLRHQSEGPARAQVNLDDTGHGTILVLDESGSPTVPITADSVGAARELALDRLATESRRRATPLHVTASDPEGTWHLLITPDGDIRDADDPQDAESPSPGAGDQAPVPGSSADPSNAAPVHTEPPPFIPRKVLRQGTSTPSARAVTTVLALPRGPLAVAAAVFVALGLLAVLLVGWFNSGGSEQPSPAGQAPAKTFPGTPPLEWDASARWVSPRLLPGSGRVLVVGQDVAAITEDRKATRFNGSTGDQRWSSDLPGGDVHTDLTRTTIDGAPVTAVHVGNTLAWWGDDGARQELVLPADSRVTFLGVRPLIRMGKEVAVVDGNQLATVAVPQGATPLAATADGVTAASTAGWWHLKPGAPATAANKWETPEGMPFTPTLISYAQESILLVNASGQTQTLYVYRDRPTAVRFMFGSRLPEGAAPVGPRDWRVSPSHTWGVLGRTLVNLNAGTTTDLGTQWSTRHVATDRALGASRDRQLIAGPAIPVGVISTGEAFPEDTVGADGIVRLSGGDAGDVIYVLPTRSNN